MENINLFKIAETKSFLKLKIEQKLKNKIQNEIYPILKENPFFGNNIKKLKGNLDSIYRYRIGNYRLFYTINDKEIIVIIIDLKHRQNAYKG